MSSSSDVVDPEKLAENHKVHNEADHELTGKSEEEDGNTNHALSDDMDATHSREDDHEDQAEDDDSPTMLDRVLSRATSRSSMDGPPPDGGWMAWSQCKLPHFALVRSTLTHAGLAGHLVIMNTW